MGDYLQVGDLSKKKEKEVFNTQSTEEINEQSVAYKSAPKKNADKSKERTNLMLNMRKAMAEDMSFENLKDNPAFAAFSEALPLAMQGLSLHTLKTYYQIKNKTISSDASEYLSNERAEWVESFKNKIERSRGIKFTNDDDDEYQEKTFSEVVKELEGHININAGNAYTAFKDSVLSFNEYTNANEFDMKEYSARYHLALSNIEEYIKTHKSAKSLWGRKRLRMAKSLRVKMQMTFDPDKFFIEKFENLGAIELKNVHEGIYARDAHLAPEYAKMSVNAGNLGKAGARIIGKPISGSDLVKEKDGNYEYKPLVGEVMNSNFIMESPVQKNNLKRMYSEVNAKAKVSKEAFTKSLIISTIAQKISDVSSLISNATKIKEDIIQKKQEKIANKKQKIKELTEAKDAKEADVNRALEEYNKEEKATKSEENSINQRISEIESVIKTAKENRDGYQKKYDEINSENSSYSLKIKELDDETHPLNVEIKALEKVNELNSNNALEFEKSFKGFTKSWNLESLEDNVNNISNRLKEGYPEIYEKRNKEVERYNKKISKLDEDINAEKEKRAGNEYINNIKNEYDSYLKIVEGNPVKMRQNAIILDFNQYKNNFYLSLITGKKSAELIKKYDDAWIKGKHEDAYTKHYNELREMSIPMLEEKRRAYFKEAKEHNEKADAFNAMLEAKVRTNLGLGPNTPIPANIVMYKMEKMDDSDEMKKAFAIRVPAAASILKADKRAGLLKELNENSESFELEYKSSYGEAVDLNTYGTSVDQLNSDKFSEINYKKDVVIDSLERQKEKLLKELLNVKEDIAWYEGEEAKEKESLNNVKAKFDELYLKELKEYGEKNLSRVKKELEDKKQAAINEKNKALEAESEEIKNLNGEISLHNDNINQLKERIENLGNRKALKKEVGEAAVDLERLQKSLKNASEELKNLETNEDETKAISSIETNREDYTKDVNKLNIMNDAVAQFFFISEGVRYIGDKNEPGFEDKKAIYNEFSNLGLVNVFKSPVDLVNLKETMASFIFKFSSITGSLNEVNITKDDALNMAENALSLYADIVKNIA